VAGAVPDDADRPGDTDVQESKNGKVRNRTAEDFVMAANISYCLGRIAEVVSSSSDRIMR